MKKLAILLTFGLLSLLAYNKAFSQSFNGGLIAGATFSQVDGDLYAGITNSASQRAATSIFPSHIISRCKWS